MKTGIEYPTIELAGKSYELKFTRGALLYRISQRGMSISMLRDPVKRIAATFDILHAIIGDQFEGTPEDLASIAIDEDKLQDITESLKVALGKAFPSTQPAQATAVTALQ